MTDMKTWSTPEGWYPDPEQPDQQRYWDGSEWTQHMAPLAPQAAPLQPAAPVQPTSPVYRRPWFIAVAVVGGLFVLAGMFGGDEGEPQPVTPVADTAVDNTAETTRSVAPAEPVDVSLSVPDVVGADEAEATAELEDAGLDVLVRRVEVAGASKGEVVRQSPRAGADADEGSRVTISVATGIVTMKVPDVTGMGLANGKSTLRAKGFAVEVTRVEDDAVPEGQIIEHAPAGEAAQGSTISLTVAKAPVPELTSGQENALRTADDYLAFSAFSRTGLIEQLEFEGYSNADASFAVDYLDVNWKEQAAKSAQQYLDMSGFSRSGLIEQLEFEGYTTEQATYGVDQAM